MRLRDRQQHGPWRNLASSATKLALQGAIGARTPCKISAFRAFRTRVREAFADYRGAFVSIDALLTWGTTRFGVAVVRHEPACPIIRFTNYWRIRLL